MRLFFCKGCNRVTNLGYCYKCGEVSQEIRTIEYKPEHRVVTVNGDSFEISAHDNKRGTGRQQNPVR